MTTSEVKTYIDLSITREAFDDLGPAGKVDHYIRREMGSWAGGMVIALATVDALNNHKTNHPDGYAALEERAERELGIERPYPRILSLVPSEETYPRHPEPIFPDTEVA